MTCICLGAFGTVSFNEFLRLAHSNGFQHSVFLNVFHCVLLAIIVLPHCPSLGPCLPALPGSFPFPE